MAFVAAIGSGQLRDFFDFWKARRDTGAGVPLKRAFDPLIMPVRWLPHLCIYQRLGSRFLIRLVGTSVVNADGFDPTGRYLDEVVPEHLRTERHQLFADIIATGLPALYLGQYPMAVDRLLGFARLLVPVSSDGRIRDHLIGMVLFSTLSVTDPRPAVETVIRCTQADIEA